MNPNPVSCRICGAQGLLPILDFGRMPLANALLTQAQLAQAEDTYPLFLAFCPSCTLVQITETVPPEKLFGEYLYFSSFSDTVLQNARSLADRLIASRHLNRESLVVELASNDGYLLANYRRAEIPVLGIEPAANIAKVAEARGIRTRCAFFGQSVAEQLREEGLSADVIHANNVLAHVADLNGFVAGIALLLKPQGVAVVEAPYVKEMIDRVEFDTVYHEHLCYFSLTALCISSAGMDWPSWTWNVCRSTAVRCGSSPPAARASQAASRRRREEPGTPHATARRRTAGSHGRCAAPSSGVAQTLAEEIRWGVEQIAFYRGFGEKVRRLRDELLALIRRLKNDGKRIAVYGASAKGSTLLNFFGLGAEELDFVVDRSTVKQGFYTPGTHLPICPPERLLEAMPDYALLLSWNFADEILAQQAEYRRRGRRLHYPHPGTEDRIAACCSPKPYSRKR